MAQDAERDLEEFDRLIDDPQVGEMVQAMQGRDETALEGMLNTQVWGALPVASPFLFNEFFLLANSFL